MKLSVMVSLMGSVAFYTLPARAGPAQAVGQELGAMPMQVPTSPSMLSVVEESVVASPHGNDRHYLNGIKFSYTTEPMSGDSIFNLPTRWLGDCTFLFHRQTGETDERLAWTILGQSIFTPENHLLSDPSLNDRPYAAWLYTGLNFIQDVDARQLTSLEFLTGIVGPWALGRQVQNNVHALFGEHLARGWNHQLSNEFGFTASWDRKWRFNHELGNRYSWEIIPDAGITAGNVFTFAEAGFLLRWGRGLKADWGPDMICPGYSGTSYFCRGRADVNVGWNLFFGMQGRIVARNIFLDGNSFQNSRSVVKEPAVADLMAGVEVFSRRTIRFGFSIVVRTPEFRKQRGIDNFGSFNGTYVF